MFDAYRPGIQVPGACPHPTRLVESAAMAAATAPPSAYRPTLPEYLVTQGIFSDAQLETVCRAGSAHAEHLPGEGGESGPRQGFFVGDGTGVGRNWTYAGSGVNTWAGLYGSASALSFVRRSRTGPLSEPNVAVYSPMAAR